MWAFSQSIIFLGAHRSSQTRDIVVFSGCTDYCVGLPPVFVRVQQIFGVWKLSQHLWRFYFLHNNAACKNSPGQVGSREGPLLKGVNNGGVFLDDLKRRNVVNHRPLLLYAGKTGSSKSNLSLWAQ